MRKQTLPLILLAVLALPGAASATLLGRLPATVGGMDYQAYYDDVLDITWLANANLAASNTFGLTQSAGVGPAAGEVGSTGLMTWATANLWIAGMNAADHLGFDDWRLPTLSPVSGGAAFNVAFSTNGTTDVAYGATGIGWQSGAGEYVSEMGYMYYVNFGNLGFCTPNDANPDLCVQQTGWGLANTADFVNLQSRLYWSGVEFGSGGAWNFNFGNGAQGADDKSRSLFAWAVRSGDVEAAVPEPATAALLGASLVGFAALRRRARRPGAWVL